MIYLTVMTTIVELLLLIVIIQNIKRTPRVKKTRIKEVVVADTLTEKKIKDDVDLERDKDFVLIDNYLDYIKSFLDNYHQSRSRRISRLVRRQFISKCISMVPTFSKYVTIDYYYDPEDKAFTKITDKDLVSMLEDCYNDLTHDNLESFSTIIAIALWLREDK